jgi:hypothetical protein
MPRVEAVGRQWYSHPYNRSDLYRLAAGLGWLPRRLRLALARQIGRLAPALMPAARAAIRDTMARLTGATGSRWRRSLVGCSPISPCASALGPTNAKP